MFRETPWTVENKKCNKKRQKSTTKNSAILRKGGKKAEDLVGKVFGWLTVLERVENTVTSDGRPYVTFLCRCKCGNLKRVLAKNLKGGHVKSCGCLRRGRASELKNSPVNKKIKNNFNREVKKEKKKNKKSLSFKLFGWTIKIKN